MFHVLNPSQTLSLRPIFSSARVSGASKILNASTAIFTSNFKNHITHAYYSNISIQKILLRQYSTTIPPKKSSTALPHERELTEEELKTISQDILRSQDPQRNYTKVRQATNAIEKKPTIDLLVSRAKAYVNLRMYNLAALDYEQAAELALQNKQAEKHKLYLEEAQTVKKMYSRDDLPIHWFQNDLVFDNILNHSIMMNRPWKDSTWTLDKSLEYGKIIKYTSPHLMGSNVSATKWWKKAIEETSPKQVDINSREDRPLTHVPWLFDILRTLSFIRPELLTLSLSSSVAGSGYGIYSTQFFNGNKWEVVIIDDEIPLLKNMPRLTRSEEEYDMWPLLLEKAYAKFLGSYQAIRDLKERSPAYIMDVLTHFTGGSFVRYNHDSEFLDLMYTLISDFEKEHAIIVAYTHESWKLTTGEYQNGLKRGTVPYFVTKISTVRMPNGEQKKFVRLRNPHFHDGVPKVWTGRYNYNDRELWTSFLKRELEYESLLESEFIMEYEAFINHFRYSDVLHSNEILRQWKKTTVGEFNINPKVPAQFQLTMPKKDGTFYFDVNQLGSEIYPIRMVVYQSHKKKIQKGEYLEIQNQSDFDILTEDSMWRQNRFLSIGYPLKADDTPRTIQVIVDAPKPVPVQIVLKSDNKMATINKVEDKKLSFFEAIELDWYLAMFLLVALFFFMYIFWGVQNMKKKRIEEAKHLQRLKDAAHDLAKARKEESI